MSCLVTTHWCGFHKFTTEESKIIFEDTVNKYVAERVYPHVHKIIFPTPNADLTDIMYHTLDVDWCAKSIHHRLWVLAIARLICKVHGGGGLIFSDLHKKYFYLDKITTITQEVDWDIRTSIAKQFLAKSAGYAMLGVCVYKYATPLLVSILDLLHLS
jgi:hypothetical protein